MRILVIAAGYPTPIGQCHLYYLARHLQGRCKLDLVCFGRNEDLVPDGRETKLWFESTSVVPMPASRRLFDICRAVATVTPLAVLTHESAYMQEEIRKRLREKQYDLVLVEQLAMAQYQRLVRDTPVLLFPVDAVSRLKRQYWEASSHVVQRMMWLVDRLLTFRYERKVYGGCSGVMFVSDVDAEYSEQNQLVCGEKIYVLPNGVDIEYFRPGGLEDTVSRTLVFVGNMQNQINQDGVIWFCERVWPAVKHAFPDLRFYIVGNSPPQRVQDLAGMGSDVVVTGYVKDLRPFLERATVFVAPLRIGTGIKNRVLQAMSMGRAIVASPLAVEGIEVADGEHLLVARTPSDYVGCISLLLVDPATRRKLGGAARAVARTRYSLDVTSHRFIQIASAIVERKVVNGS